MKVLVKHWGGGILLLFLIACQSGSDIRTFEGDLTFKLVDFGSFYALQDGLGEQFTVYIDSLQNLPAETLSPYEQEFVQTTHFLEENKLLYLPYFKLKVDSVIYTVYCDSNDYALVRDFKRSELVKEGKKVSIRISADFVTEGKSQLPPVLRCRQILSLEQVKGVTEWRK